MEEGYFYSDLLRPQTMAERAKRDASRQADADMEQNRRAMGEVLQKAATQMGGGVVCDTRPSVTGGSYTTCNK